MKSRILVIIVILALALSAQAGPTLITNDSPLTGPGTTRANIVFKTVLPSSLSMGKAEENSAQIFLERQNVLLTSDLAVVGGWIPAGARVNSYILHFDPVGSASSPVWEARGTITFAEPLLGLIYATSNTATYSLLTASDSIVGLGGSYYESGTYHRKLEIPQETWEDLATLPGNTVYVNLFTNSSMDEVRIITQVVPAPGALLLGALGAALVGCLRRGKSL